MPSSPVLCDRSREVRSFKVERELYAHHLGNTACNIYTAGEITIYLYRIAEHAEEHCGTGQLIKHLYGKNLCDHGSHSVSYNKLFKETKHDELCAVSQVFIVDLVLFCKLFPDIIISGNGTLYYRREKRKE